MFDANITTGLIVRVPKKGYRTVPDTHPHTVQELQEVFSVFTGCKTAENCRNAFYAEVGSLVESTLNGFG